MQKEKQTVSKSKSMIIYIHVYIIDCGLNVGGCILLEQHTCNCNCDIL